MRYIKVFETQEKAKFREASTLFRRENIKYEVLYEYRLYSEKRHDSLENRGAVIRVPRSVFHDANRLLIEQGLKTIKAEESMETPLDLFIERIFPELSSSARVLLSIVAVALIVLATVLVLFRLLNLAIAE